MTTNFIYPAQNLSTKEFRIKPVPMKAHFSRVTAFHSPSECMYVVQKKVGLGNHKFWLNKRQFSNLELAENYLAKNY